LKKNACLEKVASNFQLKQNHNYFFQVQQQLLTFPERKYNDFVCAFDSSHHATIIKERIYPDHGHWREVLPKLTTFWRTCILPEILGRWYTRKCDISDECHKQLLEFVSAECHHVETLSNVETPTAHLLNFIPRV